MNKRMKAKYDKEYRARNKDKLSRQKREYYILNKDKIKKKNTQYRKDNVEKARTYVKKYYYNNIDKQHKRKKLYYNNIKNKNPALYRSMVMLNGIHTRAKTFNRLVGTDLDKEYILMLLASDDICKYCKKVMVLFSDTKSTKDVVSIDRINNRRGYTKDNIQIICVGCNSKKRQISHKNFSGANKK